MNQELLDNQKPLTGTKIMSIYDGLHQYQMVDLQSPHILLKNEKKILVNGLRLPKCHQANAKALYHIWMKIPNMNSVSKLSTLLVLEKHPKLANQSSLNQENVSTLNRRKEHFPRAAINRIIYLFYL